MNVACIFFPRSIEWRASAIYIQAIVQGAAAAIKHWRWNKMPQISLRETREHWPTFTGGQLLNKIMEKMKSIYLSVHVYSTPTINV